MLVKVAVTGALSCGKSSVCRFFKELGAHVVSADEIVHQLLSSPTTPIAHQIITLLGEEIVVSGQIDRSLMAKKVFNDAALLHSLEKILHPAVLSEINKQYQKALIESDATLFVAEVPLLFEITGETFFDFTIVVKASQEISRHRFKVVTGYDDAQYDKRMARQMAADEKAKRADYIIENNGSIEEMHQAVKTLFKKLVSSTNER